ncbi:response regulator [Haliangium sp.]|uniref:response regulator n=1 Tax=Haliangium sp. TaxID=2663208 RepID=UPI003D1032D2
MGMDAQHHVLVVEDEPVTRALLVAYLERAGYRVSPAVDGDAMRAVLRDDPAELILLDIGLPGEDGFELASSTRAASGPGIIFVTRRADIIDRVVGLELGGDDYIVKPPDMRELLARVKAVLRRRGAPPPPRPAPAVQRFAGFSFDRERRSLVSPRGEVIALTTGEMTILIALLEAGGRVVPRGEIIKALQTAGANGSTRSLHVLVHRLRAKLGEGGAIAPRILLTVRHVGYRIAAELE